MAHGPPHPKEEPTGEPVPDFQQAFSNLSNSELLSALDLALLELEKRLFRYAKVGPELLEMADEGLVLAAIYLLRGCVNKPRWGRQFIADSSLSATDGIRQIQGGHKEAA
jgi:hypothetical protein